ncbi:non-ribosomal peptide synthetase [Rhizobium leguminosarum bv. viciae 248]|uniref:non-ribosomal peptide synthetase n=1 Tax=Rhizobium leguminosarum TaxID=384 RepID=UPI00036EA747|nr:non-ribosomal peptide synthetase [Rhizobium leguminosarum]NKM64348.1 non-ribosomal peptide synthetase [Rhizobium leguminosarum bv. viciae]QHW23259.1 non-ribosomal peptide synthetase [Rhizobium leguminosarum bv. viciae 248]
MTAAPQRMCNDGLLRCSHGQQGLWLVDQLNPGSPAYNIHAAVCSPFVLDPTHLAAAAAALVERHETLRTSFEWDGYEPVQRILPRGRPCLRMADLRSMSGEAAEDELTRLSREDAATPFDLGGGSLLRLGLVQLPGVRSVLLITIHHIVADAWSLNILLRDLLELYISAATRRVAQLPGLPIQYADFAAWQRDLLSAERTTELVAGWRSYLSGAGVLELPTDRPRGSDPAQEGAHHRFAFSPDISEACRQRSREFAVTPYALVTGCFAEVLHRYGGSNDFMIGMPSAGRSRVDIENLIGYFAHMVVLRIDLTNRPSFREIAARIWSSMGEALSLQDLPFERVVEIVEPDRDIAVNPLFQVTSQFLATPVGRADSGSLEVVDLHRGFANFDLTLDFWEENGIIAGRIEYSRELYEPSTISRLAGHLATLLEAALVEPDRPLAEHDMLTADERRLVVEEWSAGPQDYPANCTLGMLFAEIAADFPERPAVRCGEGTLSYAQLEREASGLAARLLAAGVKPGDHVGLFLSRQRAQIVAALGVVLAGAGYVALDPAWPDERIAAMINTAGLHVSVAQDGSDERLQRLRLQAVAHSGRPADRVVLPVGNPEATAYVAFTSGSTGEPKGVPATHRGVIRLMRGGPPIEFAPDDVMLAYAPLGFDASTLEIWGPLLNGACVALAPDRPLSPHELADFIESASVTKAWLTAGLFSQISLARPATLAALRVVYSGGDVLPEPAVRRVLQAGGTVVNGYGPTENTVFTSCFTMSGENSIAQGIRIGRPASGTRVYILDREGRPVPAGVPGELVAGGAGVSPGYLGGHADNVRFVEDPLHPALGRAYRTGDMARWTVDGEIEFLGRRDRQVKVRGFRVELGEIENAILREPYVRDCVVAVRGVGADEKGIAAFVVFRDDEGDAAGLRRALAARLPAHARPSSIIALAAMPLGANGKVDVAALLEMPVINDSETARSGPLTEIEDIVAEAFASVLGCASIPANYTFFDLGHSLHATRVITRLREALDIDLPLQAIFENPTVRGLAARIEDILLLEFESVAEGME